MDSRIGLIPLRPESLEQTDNIFQGVLWARLKAGTGWKPLAFRLHWETRNTTLLVLVRKTGPRSSIAYVPAGPDLQLPDEEQGPMLETLSISLESHLPANTVYVRYDLPWRTPYVDDVGAARPEPRVREMRMNFGTRYHNLRKSFTDIQPTDTLIVDITQPQEKLLARMKPKTRYNIRLAGRHGIRVREAGKDELPRFHEIYRQTARRNGIQIHRYEYFERILDAARTTDEGSNAHLLLADKDDSVLAGMVLARSRDRATYLYGASADRGRSYMPTYALQWEAMRLARRSGCSRYDMYGVPPRPDTAHPMAGLYRFKSGFGGHSVHRRGCWDYPYRSDDYEQICEQELMAPGYHVR